jgi:hypothetical protein
MAEELQKTSAQTTALDTFDDLVADAGAGTENITSNDVRPPVMKLCQSGNPERKPDNPKQIQGLQELDLFNSLSSEIYGRTIRFTVIAMLGHKWIEFDKDLKVVERDIPDGDPRTEWTENENGERVKPVATMFYDYLLWLIDNNEVVAFSLKSTQIKNAIKLNGLLKLPLKIGDKIIPNPPAWARVYKLETKMEQDKQYAWGGYNLSTDGVTPADVRQLCSGLSKHYSGKKIEIERDEADAVDSKVEAPAAQGTGDPSDM